MKNLVLSFAVVTLIGAAGVLAYAFWPPDHTEPLSPPTGADHRVPTPSTESPLTVLKGPQKGLRVLFVGNSHTFTHNVPELVTKISAASNVDRPLLSMSEAPGGYSFKMHAEGSRVDQLLGQVKWDLVVLQDQSAMPYQTRAQRNAETLPFARKLDEKIRDSGARTVLFMTWGYEADFLPMQQRSRQAYEDLGRELEADVVPVGLAWEKAFKSRPGLDLWMDGNHATMKGAYLAACTFFAAFYGKSPVGNPFTAGLDAADARFLQESALAAVPLQPGGLAAKTPGRVP